MKELKITEEVSFTFSDESQTASGAYTYDETPEHSNLAAVTKNSTFLGGEFIVLDNVYQTDFIYTNNSVAF